jgi:hypothetical protein
MSVLLTGYYDIYYAQLRIANIHNVCPGWIEQYPENTTMITALPIRLPAVCTVPDTPLFYEEYTWTTYEDTKLEVKLGLITYNSLYPDEGISIASEPSIQEMVVLGADGIYEGVTKVIMDFNDQKRKIEFMY